MRTAEEILSDIIDWEPREGFFSGDLWREARRWKESYVNLRPNANPPLDLDWDKALQEGWCVFESDGALQIERDDESDIFRTDEQAEEFVIRRARQGSTYHLSALEYVSALNAEMLHPPRHAKVYMQCRNWDCTGVMSGSRIVSVWAGQPADSYDYFVYVGDGYMGFHREENARKYIETNYPEYNGKRDNR